MATKTEEFSAFVRWLTNNNLDFTEGPLIHAAVGIGGEAGELFDCVKRSFVYHQPIDHANVQEELGDILHYVMAAANVFGWTLEDLIENNMQKLKKRYPDGYSDAAAVARKDKEDEHKH